MKTACKLVVLAVLVALPAGALDVSTVKQGAVVHRGRSWEQVSEYESAVKEGGRLVVRVDNGTVNIQPVAGDKINCAVTLRAYTSDQSYAQNLFDKFQLSARSVEGGGVFITAEAPAQLRHGVNFSVRFQITVPQRFNLDVETGGGDINIAAPLDGEARLTTAGGDVHVSDLTGPGRIESAGGSITVGKVAGELTVRTAGGAIHVGDVKGDLIAETSGGEIVTGNVGGVLKAGTAGGDIVIGGAAGPLTASTAGGQIQIGPTSGTVRVETAGGSIRVQGSRGHVLAETAGGSIDLLQVEGGVKASTAAGRILAQFNSTRKTFGPSQLETSMGDVFVYLPPTLPLTIDAYIETAAGRQIQSDFPLNIEGDKGELVPSTLHGRGALNGGGDVLKIRTVAGNIEIHKIDDASLRDLQQREESNWKAWGERRADRDRRNQARQKERQQNDSEDDHDQ